MIKADRIWGIAVLVLGGIYLVQGIRIPPPAIGDPLGPRVFPSILGGLMCASGIFMIFRPGPVEEQPVLDRRSFLPILTLFAFLLLYAALLPSLGYLVATFLFVMAVALIMGERSLPRGLAVAALFSCGIFFLFTRILTIPLPLGLLKTLGF